MADLDVNKQFFSKAFEDYKNRWQGELTETKAEISDTALNNREVKKPYPLKYKEKNGDQEVEKVLLINSDQTKISGLAYTLLYGKEIIKERTSSYIPDTHWVMREDGEGDRNFDISVGEQKRDVNGNLLQGESINILIDKDGDPVSISLFYTDFTTNPSASYTIILNPDGKIEIFTLIKKKNNKIKGKTYTCKDKKSLDEKLEKIFPNNKPKQLQKLFPVA